MGPTGVLKQCRRDGDAGVRTQVRRPDREGSLGKGKGKLERDLEAVRNPEPDARRGGGRRVEMFELCQVVVLVFRRSRWGVVGKNAS